MDGIALITKTIIKWRYMDDETFEIGNQIWKSGSDELNFNGWNK